MIDHKSYAKMLGTSINGRARKTESDMVVLNSWWEDIQSQTAYMYDYYHDTGDERFQLIDLHPDRNSDKVPISIKFIRHEKQSYNKDPVTFWLQLQPGQECVLDYYEEMYQNKYGNIWPVGCYVDIMDESGKYNKWLCVNTANYNQNQFPTFELLRCDYIVQWIHGGHKYECPAVLQSQNSQIVRFIWETIYRKFSNCGKPLRANILKRKDEICLNVNVIKSCWIGKSTQQSPDEGCVQRAK